MAFIGALLVASLLVSASASPADWPCTWSSFPRGTPSSTWPDGPYVGNGNAGLVIGGAAGELNLYGTVHGFWSNSAGKNSSMPPLTTQLDSGFPSCPGPTCNITVGLTLMRLLVSAPTVADSWTATLDIERATATAVLGGAHGAALVATLYMSATSQVAIFELRNVGATALSTVNVTLAANGNTQNVPLTAGCPDAAHDDAPGPCPSSPALGVTAVVTKDANSKDAHSSFPITAAAAARVVAATAGWTPTLLTPFSSTERQSSWTASNVNTLTLGVSSIFSLAPGAAVTYALSMAASRDPGVLGVTTPVAAVAARVAAVNAAALEPLRTAHEAWWGAYWNRSAVSLGGEPATEAFWYSSIYALGSGTRAGYPVMDLWSPFRTTDYSAWRSNPTMVRATPPALAEVAHRARGPAEVAHRAKRTSGSCVPR